jgi:hypothetical protein
MELRDWDHGGGPGSTVTPCNARQVEDAYEWHVLPQVVADGGEPDVRVTVNPPYRFAIQALKLVLSPPLNVC